MKLGFFGANVGGMVAREAGEVAAYAEELGYHSLWTGEHLVLPSPRQQKPPLDPDWPMADPLVTLGFLAAHTERMQLCTGIVVATLRQPVQLAKEAATVDVLSGGRLVLGAGVGYLDVEYRAMGVPKERRRARFREHLQALKALWTMKEPAFHGDFVSFDGIDAHPRPVSPDGIPLVLGGASNTALQDAAELGSGWYGFGQTPAQVAQARSIIVEQAEQFGRDLTGFEITVTPRARLTPELVEEYRTAGVTQLVVTVESDTLEGVRRRLDFNAPGRLGAS
ncbi:LLM class F420-dependent oxidoreductase [Streptomyces sp. NPDC096310]|uniref:LLM class F420-dependent oxidoreductase n=1 Tax=Streptomyces sp. NPDC096310 TaxID=3366082 RepID=UPI00381E448A